MEYFSTDTDDTVRLSYEGSDYGSAYDAADYEQATQAPDADITAEDWYGAGADYYDAPMIGDQRPPEASAEPERDPRELLIYGFTGASKASRNDIQIGSDSMLMNPSLSLAARGEEVYVDSMTGREGVTGYTRRVEISAYATGEQLGIARFKRHEYAAPQHTNVITPDGMHDYQSRGWNPSDVRQRGGAAPPDEAVIDTLPDNAEAIADTIEGMLRGYAADMINRITVPDPEVDGVVWFSDAAVAVAGWSAERAYEMHLRDNLVGHPSVGLNRLTLVNYHSWEAAARGVIDNSPELEGARQALSRLGCTVTAIRPSYTESGQEVQGIEIEFEHRKGLVMDEPRFDRQLR